MARLIPIDQGTKLTAEIHWITFPSRILIIDNW
jgi:hypothetical protein